MKKVFVVLALFALTCLVASAAAIDGKWMTEAPAGGKGGPQTLTLKADGAKLTGSLDAGRGMPADISDGKVDGMNVSFAVVQDFGGNKVTSTYKGMLMGDDLKLTRTREGAAGGKGPASQDLVFKRSK